MTSSAARTRIADIAAIGNIIALSTLHTMIFLPMGIVMGFISTAEAARRWGVSERSVRNYCAKGRVDGAMRSGRVWLIPEDASKPTRLNGKKRKANPLLTRLREERDHHIRGGIYHRLQVDFTYNSNHMEGSTLTLDQTRLIFETATLGTEDGNKILRVDDIVETANHFRCIDYCLDIVERPLSETITKELHRILKTGTTNAGLDWFAVGDYKRVPNEVGGRNTVAPKDVPAAVRVLIDSYEAASSHDLRDLIDFHVRFERIHPFQDGNGRVSRLLLLKECLRQAIVPFVISDDMRWYYYHGLAEWDREHGYFMDTCLAAQDRFKEWLNYFAIPYDNENPT